MSKIKRSKVTDYAALMNQYSKFQNEEISRLDFIKMVGYRFSAKTDIQSFKPTITAFNPLNYSQLVFTEA